MALIFIREGKSPEVVGAGPTMASTCTSCAACVGTSMCWYTHVLVQLCVGTTSTGTMCWYNQYRHETRSQSISKRGLVFVPTAASCTSGERGSPIPTEMASTGPPTPLLCAALLLAFFAAADSLPARLAEHEGGGSMRAPHRACIDGRALPTIFLVGAQKAGTVAFFLLIAELLLVRTDPPPNPNPNPNPNQTSLFNDLSTLTPSLDKAGSLKLSY
jgi:hypothetical protein